MTAIYDDIPALWSVYDEEGRCWGTGYRTKGEAEEAMAELAGCQDCGSEGVVLERRAVLMDLGGVEEREVSCPTCNPFT